MRPTRQLNQKGNVNRLIVQKEAVALFPMFSERFPVVCDYRDHGGIVKTSGLQSRKEGPQRRVDIRDFSVIRRGARTST